MKIEIKFANMRFKVPNLTKLTIVQINLTYLTLKIEPILSSGYILTLCEVMINFIYMISSIPVLTSIRLRMEEQVDQRH
ncbi:hypothetical protein T01_15572 [Trichinella spiralis]|uniref:Uncharacterized protein n=1 Tax=Trichinella spiralis TaxID=6334 RepID=A0A0V1BBZ2_TRISP|nr:hypothetical protein T01_15572 [Trichinella spiralis]